MLLDWVLEHKHKCPPVYTLHTDWQTGRIGGVHACTCAQIFTPTFPPLPPVRSESTADSYICTLDNFHYSFRVIHSVLVSLKKNEIHKFKKHLVLYRVIRAYHALYCNLNNTMQITFLWDFSGRMLYSNPPTQEEEIKKCFPLKIPLGGSGLRLVTQPLALCTHHMMCRAQSIRSSCNCSAAA